jgi:hypothetical protein
VVKLATECRQFALYGRDSALQSTQASAKAVLNPHYTPVIPEGGDQDRHQLDADNDDVVHVAFPSASSIEDCEASQRVQMPDWAVCVSFWNSFARWK